MGVHAKNRYEWEGEMLTIPQIAKREGIDYKQAYHCAHRAGYTSLDQVKKNRAVIIEDKIYPNMKTAAIARNQSYQQIHRMLKMGKIKVARASKAIKPESRRNKEAKLRAAWERIMSK